MKFYKTLLIVLFLSLVASCSEKQRDSIAFGLNTAPVTLDPRFATDAFSYRITRLLYQSLIDFDEQFQVIPSLADWQQLSLTHYRFILKDDLAKFHNGVQLTADDVKATYESVLDPITISPHSGSVNMIDHMEVIDDNTIDFYLTQNDHLFPGRLVIGIMPKTLIESKHDFSHHPIGNGPMQFLDWQDEAKLQLERINDNQVIEFLTVKDPTVRVLKLLKGEVDLIQGDIPPEIVSWLAEHDSVTIKKKHGDTFSYLGFNLEDPATGQLAVRRAIAYAIDRESIIKYVMGDSARLAGAIFPPEHWAGHPSMTGNQYDPDEAKRLLIESGYDQSNPLKLIYKTSNNAFRLRLATIIQDQLQQVGIDMEIRSYDWGTFYADIKAGRFQVFSLSWVGLKMPDIFRYVFHSESIPPVGANRGRFKDSVVDDLIEQGENEKDIEEQIAIYQSIQERLAETLPYIPLWYEDNVLAIRNDIKGYELSMDGNFDALTTTSRSPQ